MVDLSFPIEELEYYLLIAVRVSCFVFAAPFFGMNNTPNYLKIGFSLVVAYLLYGVITPHVYIDYSTPLTYASYVLKEAITGILIGLGAQFCMTIVSFSGTLVDMEIGFSMASQMDPVTKQNTTLTGFYYQYAFLLIFIVTGMYRYLLQALAETFALIPVGQTQFSILGMYQAFVNFMVDYIAIGFQICLPVFCTILLLNGILGIMAKVSPQMNMFAVGIQMKVLTGLGVLFLTTGLLPKAADFVFEEMKIVIVMFVKAMGGTG